MKLVITDLDRCLLDTERLEHDLKQALLRLYEIDADHFGSEITRFTTEDGYDLFRHLDEGYSIDPASAASQLRAELTGDYLFPDVRPLITRLRCHGYEIRGVTTGADAYQSFKIGLHPDLDDIPFEIVGMNKGEWIHPRLTSSPAGLTYMGVVYEEVVFLDDKASPHGALPPRPGLRRIRVSRPGAKYGHEKTPPGVEEYPGATDIPFGDVANAA